MVAGAQALLNAHHPAQTSWALYLTATISETLSTEQLKSIYLLLKIEFDRLNYDSLSTFNYVVLRALILALPSLRKHGVVDDEMLYNLIILKYPEDRHLNSDDLRLYDIFNELVSVMNRNTVDFNDLAVKFYQILTNEFESKFYRT